MFFLCTVRTKQKLMSKDIARVLVAPMDWGLGHATRCIPLVNALQKAGIEVIIAAEGAQLSLLQKEFPQLKFIHLQGYRIRYSVSKRLFSLKIATQIPKILQTIYQEKQWLKKAMAEYAFDMVISDNRYGLHHKDCYNIFITHQLNIAVAINGIRSLVRKLNYRLIEKFDECWVPDFDGAVNMAGELSHPAKLPAMKIEYLGCLSRFSFGEQQNVQFNYCAVISGPEPQRSIFESLVLDCFKNLPGKKLLISGRPGDQTQSLSGDDITIHSHAEAKQLQQLLSASRFIITRAGYSTVMDLVAMKRSALLVATPGQTEQEYLATYLSEKKWFSSVAQEDLTADFIQECEYHDREVFPYGNVETEIKLEKIINGLFNKQSKHLQA